MKWLSETQKNVQDFHLSKCMEIRAVAITQNEQGELNLATDILHGVNDLIRLEFLGVTNISVRLIGGTVEIGELLIAKDDGEYRVWDELKPLRWRCREIMFKGVWVE